MVEMNDLRFLGDVYNSRHRLKPKVTHIVSGKIWINKDVTLFEGSGRSLLSHNGSVRPILEPDVFQTEVQRGPS